MEQVQQLIEILKSTPEMALWGLGLFFGWTLLKLASVVSAVTMVVKLSINKTHDYMNRNAEFKNKEHVRVFHIKETELAMEKQKLDNDGLKLRKDEFIQFLDDISISKDVYQHHWRKAISKLHNIGHDYNLEYKYMHKQHMDLLLEILTQVEKGDIKLKRKERD